MPTSEARILANRKNSERSTGPKTAAGKERSRRNGLKHGMSGRGIVIPEGDAAEVERRQEALAKELAPSTVMGAILVGQMATLSIRMERGARQEFAAVAQRVRHASDDFDAARVVEAQALLKGIGDDPRGNLRKLLRSPEGVEVLIEAWGDLRADLTRESRPSWSATRGASMVHLLGLRESDDRAGRIGALTRATWADFSALAEGDGGGLDREARRQWARARLLERIAEEIADLEEHHETLDFEAIEQDRAEAGARALFDPSREAGLARRYEAEARRGFFRSLKEFRGVEAEAEVEAAGQPAPAPMPSAVPEPAPLASSREEPSPGPDDLDADPFEWTPEAFGAASMGDLRAAAIVQGGLDRAFEYGRRAPVPT